MKKIQFIPNLIIASLLVIILGFCTSENKTPRVIVLGLDGMRPDGIENTLTPNLHQLIYDGTSTMNARAVYPTSSGANWSSMLLGAGPDQHGISNNDWILETRTIKPVYEKENGYSPSIFDVLKEKYPNLRFSAVFNWTPIGNYFDRSIPDTIIEVKTTKEAIDQIISEIIDKNAHFVFSQIDYMDNAGHGTGYGSDSYYQEAEILDKEIGRLLEALKQNDMYEDTYIITLSDHGGRGFGHGNKTMLEYEVPFIINGPGIIKGKTTKEAIQPFDVATTVATIFKCDIPHYMLGSTIESAFGDAPELLSDYVSKPIIIVDSLDNKYSYLHYKLMNGNEIVKYKIKNSEHDNNWKVSTDQILLAHGDTLIAATFVDGKEKRRSQYFMPYIAHKGNMAQITLKTQASEKYSSKGGKSLIDGLVAGSPSFGISEWLGFSGDDVEAIIEFNALEEINNIQVRFLENTKSWVFLPKSIKIFASDNGKTFHEISSIEKPFEMNNDLPSIKTLDIPIKGVKTKYLKIICNNYGKLPEWHSGAGKASWLFTDEIIIE